MYILYYAERSVILYCNTMHIYVRQKIRFFYIFLYANFTFPIPNNKKKDI